MEEEVTEDEARDADAKHSCSDSSFGCGAGTLACLLACLLACFSSWCLAYTVTTAPVFH